MPASAAIATYAPYISADVLASAPDGADPLWSPVAVDLTPGAEKYVQLEAQLDPQGRKGTRAARLFVTGNDADADGDAIYVTVKAVDGMPDGGPAPANLYQPLITVQPAGSTTTISGGIVPVATTLHSFDTAAGTMTFKITLKSAPPASGVYQLFLNLDFGYSASN